MSAVASRPRVFRLPLLAYVPVLFLLFGAIPLAFAGNGDQSAPAAISITTLILIVPAVAAVFVARTATVVDASGITVRAAFGRRVLSWEQLRGLSVSGRNVYAVLPDGSVRLPCVGLADLSEVSRASAGRLPEIADPTPKYAPSGRRARRRAR